MLDNRTLTYLKSEARSRAILNGEVSAADICNVQRSNVQGTVRGGFVTKAFFDLVSEGFLDRTMITEVNPVTRHPVTVYRLRW